MADVVEKEMLIKWLNEQKGEYVVLSRQILSVKLDVSGKGKGTMARYNFANLLTKNISPFLYSMAFAVVKKEDLHINIQKQIDAMKNKGHD